MSLQVANLGKCFATCYTPVLLFVVVDCCFHLRSVINKMHKELINRSLIGWSFTSISYMFFMLIKGIFIKVLEAGTLKDIFNI